MSCQLASRTLLAITLGLLCVSATCSGSSSSDNDDDDTFIFVSDNSDAFATFELDDVLVEPRGAGPGSDVAPGAPASDETSPWRLGTDDVLVLHFTNDVDETSVQADANSERPGLSITDPAGDAVAATVEVEGSRVTIAFGGTASALRGRVTLRPELADVDGGALVVADEAPGSAADPILFERAAARLGAPRFGVTLERRIRITSDPSGHRVVEISDAIGVSAPNR